MVAISRTSKLMPYLEESQRLQEQSMQLADEFRRLAAKRRRVALFGALVVGAFLGGLVCILGFAGEHPQRSLWHYSWCGGYLVLMLGRVAYEYRLDGQTERLKQRGMELTEKRAELEALQRGNTWLE